MYYIEINGSRQDLNDFYKFLYGIEPAKRTIHKGTISPQVDIKTSDDGVTFEYEIPGVNPEEIVVQLEKNELMVSADKFSTALRQDEKLERAERSIGKYVRVFTIGDEYDTDRLETNYVNGILGIYIPRKPETKPKVFKVFAEQKALKE